MLSPNQHQGDKFKRTDSRTQAPSEPTATLAPNLSLRHREADRTHAIHQRPSRSLLSSLQRLSTLRSLFSTYAIPLPGRSSLSPWTNMVSGHCCPISENL